METETLTAVRRVPASFRDPSGFLFTRDGELYRQVNACYHENFDRLISSRLYQDLVGRALLIPHEEVSVSYTTSDEAYKILKPEPISFISYPYEWSFSQLKDAALRTLEIQRRALDHDMSLKDASAYNIQFKSGKLILIDTLSFERYEEGKPWIAYRQFCEHFFAPLALMSYKDVRLSQLFRIYPDGIPLDLASKLLPFRSRLRLPVLLHIHLHATSQTYFSGRAIKKTRGRMSRMKLLGLIDNLESAVKRLKWQPKGTEWADYYDDTNYSDEAFRHKEEVVTEFLTRIRPRKLWDLGANTGRFSRLSAQLGIETIAFDSDPAAVEQSYLRSIENGEINILPLVLDLASPSSRMGWEHEERMSLEDRGPADTVMALALIHHLAISRNIPLERIARYLSKLCDSLVIEFIPKADSQVRRLLSTREDIFHAFHRDGFEGAFGRHFEIQDACDVKDSERRLYLMKKK